MSWALAAVHRSLARVPPCLPLRRVPAAARRTSSRRAAVAEGACRFFDADRDRCTYAWLPRGRMRCRMLSTLPSIAGPTGHLGAPAHRRLRTRHGVDYSCFEHCEEGIETELWVHVSLDALNKYSLLKFRNLAGQPRWRKARRSPRTPVGR